MKKLIQYFYPKKEMFFFEKQKATFFILQVYIGFLIVVISLIPELISPGSNFIVSFFSKISMILILVIVLFVLKKKGIKVAGNIFSFVIVFTLLIWMNILTENSTPLYKYIQGFYSVFAVLIIGYMFASRRFIIINAVLIFVTTTRIFIYAKAHFPEDADFFTTGYITHTIGLTSITTIIYFTKRFTELAIEKANNETKIKEQQYQELEVSKEDIRATSEELVVTTDALKESNDVLINALKIEKENERKLREAQEIAHLGYWELDLKNNKLYWSDEIYRIFDLKPQEFGATYEAFLENIHPEDRDKVNEAYLDSLKSKMPYEIEHRLLLKTGELKYVLENCNIELDKHGNPIRTMGTVLDITIMKKTELELIKAREKAEESDQLITEFIHNMSHEIRTPMNGILGFSAFLDNPELTDVKRKKFIGIVQRCGNQLLQIIDDILEISQLGTKQVKTIEKQINLNDLLLELFSIFNIKAKESKIPLYLKEGLSDKESIIFTDETKLNKILSNFLENALKYTNEGYIEFGYRLKTDNEPVELEIYVKDTGIGIKQESQSAIFDRFSQEEKELSKNVGGLGLGLSIAKENAKLLGGKISLKSEKGKGSTFYVTIPYKPANSDTESSNSNNDKRKISKNQDKYTILIVEDEEVNYLYIVTLLEISELNLKILHAKHGREALEMCKENAEIDFVFMDLKMPVMNGLEATKLIKEFRPDLPIIAQTAYSTRAEKEEAISAGCDDFISKPISEETLNEIVYKYLLTKQQ